MPGDYLISRFLTIPAPYGYASRGRDGHALNYTTDRPHLLGGQDITFHDLRHTALNNWRMEGHDYFRIMAASGHKTMSVFKRYNTVSRDELKALVGENQ